MGKYRATLEKWRNGEAGGVSKFGSEEQASEFAPIARFFVEKASQVLDDVGKEQAGSLRS